MKRKLILLFILVLTVNSIAYAKLPAPKEAYAELNSQTVEGVNLKPSMTVTPEICRRGGRFAWLLSPNVASSSARNIYFDIKDSFISKLKNYQTVKIDVEYYDSGNGTFAITYGDYNGKTSHTTYTEPHYTNEWRTESFYISDSTFTNSIDGKYDFAIAVYTPGMGTSLSEVIIGKVTVSLLEKNEHILITPKNKSEMSSFYTDDDAELSFLFSNADRTGVLNGKYNVNIKYEVFATDGELIYQDTDSVHLSTSQKEGKKIKFPLEKYGLYNVVVTAESADGKFWGKTEFPFGYVNSSKGEYLNPRYSIIAQPTRENIKLFVNAGIGNVRATAPGTRDFHMLEGEYRVAPKYIEQLRMYQDAGIDVTVCLMNYGRQLPFKTGEKTPKSDEAIAEFAEFCKIVVEDMKGITNTFELWNEYDIVGSSFNPENGTPADYTRLAKAVYKAVKEVNPDAQLLTLSTSGGASGFPSLNFVNGAFEAGIAEYSDGISIHPYYWYDSPKTGNVYDVILNGVRRIMDDHGMQSKPLYATEVGWATNYYNVTAETQGYYNVQNYIINSEQHNGKPLIDVISTYTMFDSQNYIRNDRESNFGIMHGNTPKAAYLMLANMNKLLTDSECINTLSLNENTTFVYYFNSQKRRNTNTLVMWTENKTDSVRLDLGIDEVILYDSYGNQKAIKGNSGKYTFTLTNEPIYVEGNFTSVNQTKTGSAVEIENTYFTTSEDNVFTVNFKSSSDDTFTIEPTLGGSPLEVIESTPVSNGNGSITLKTSKTQNGEEKISFDVKNDKGIFNSSNAIVKFSNPIELYLSKTLNQTDKKWYLVGTVTNNSSRDVTGALSIIAPEEIAEKSKNASNVTIASGETKRIELLLPIQNSSAPLPLSASFIEKDGFAADASMNLSFDTVSYTDEKITIDGKTDEGAWSRTTGFVLNNRDQFIDEITLAGDYKGPSDIGAVIKLLWDEEKLYISSTVTDDIHSQKGPVSDLWKYDSLQIGAVYDPKGESSSREFYELAIGLLDDGTVGLQRYENAIAVTYNLDKIESAIVRDEVAKTTTYEIALPWSELSKSLNTVASDTEFKFSMLVNDADTATRKGYYEFGSGIAQEKNSSLFKTLNLIK